MFWNSLGDAFAMLANWEVYVAGIIYVALVLGPLMILAIVSEGRTAVGCLLGATVLPIFQVFALYAYLLILSPILLRFGDSAAWTLPWDICIAEPWGLLKTILLLVVVGIAVSLIPIIGNSHSLFTLAIGAFTVIGVCSAVGDSTPNFPMESLDFVPGFWYIAGFVALGGLAQYMAALISTLIITYILGRYFYDETLETITEYVSIFCGAVFGCFPVFVYCAWIGNQLEALDALNI